MSKQEKFTKILQSMRQIKVIKEDATQAIRAIQNDSDKSGEYKLRAKMAINADTMQQVQQIHDAVLPEIEALREIIAGERADIDLSSPKLSNALSIINLAKGTELPQSVQENIIYQLKDDSPALELLLPMLKTSGLDFAAMSAEDALKASARSDNFTETIEDGFYYETLSPEPGTGINGMITAAETFATHNGLEI